MSIPDRPPRAVVFGCSGTALTDDEAALFRDAEPLGFILFGRNVETPDQLRDLVAALRATVGRDDAPILIDQEGGRVQRLGPPHWPARPAMARFGVLAQRDLAAGIEATRLAARVIAHDLAALGISVDCAPVLDVPAADGHEIIGDRAFCDVPAMIAVLGRAFCDGLVEGGVTPVVKHVPGHGRATADSHVELPRVSAARAALEATDFGPFAALRDCPAAMTAHVVYEAIDPVRPASASPEVIEGVIRRDIGFDGFLFSDDVCMKALSGPVAERVSQVIDAGCDAALHCDGAFADMVSIAEVCPVLTDRARTRLARFVAGPTDSESFDREHAEARISALLGS